MRAPKPLILALTGSALLMSCSTGRADYTRSPEAQRRLDESLAGRAAGKPVNCIPNYRATDMQIIDDWTILFKEGSTVYVQNPQGGCHGIGNHTNILVTRPVGTNRLCSGDINHLIDPVSGIGGGACVFGPFVPYTKPKS